LVTIVAILLGLVLPKVWIKDLLNPIAFLLILAGIPHGAADFVIFQQIFDKSKITKQLFYFTVGYLTITLLYAGVWWTYPFLAFVLFLFNSAYHFGESNWKYLNLTLSWKQSLVYLVWGTAILGIPVLLHFDQAAIIIEEITGISVTLSVTVRGALVYLFCFCNLIMLTLLVDAEVINEVQFYKELRNFLLLVLLFFCTPLLIGFSIYFVFWHSAHAMKDQFDYLELAKDTQKKKNYLQQLLLVSLVSFIGIGLLYAGANNLMNQGYNLGKLFVFIAIVTVPHSLLMHHLYQFKVFQEKKE